MAKSHLHWMQVFPWWEALQMSLYAGVVLFWRCLYICWTKRGRQPLARAWSAWPGSAGYFCISFSFCLTATEVFLSMGLVGQSPPQPPSPSPGPHRLALIAALLGNSAAMPGGFLPPKPKPGSGACCNTHQTNPNKPNPAYLTWRFQCFCNLGSLQETSHCTKGQLQGETHCWS